MVEFLRQAAWRFDAKFGGMPVRLGYWSVLRIYGICGRSMRSAAVIVVVSCRLITDHITSGFLCQLFSMNNLSSGLFLVS